MGDQTVHALIERADWEALLTKCKRSLSRKPENELATEVLYQLFVRQLGSVSSDELEGVCIRAAAVLERTFRATRCWDRLVKLLQIRIENCDAADQRLELHLRLARVYENQLREDSLAFGTLARAFGELPGRLDILRDLERLADRGDRWEELVGLLLDAAEGQNEDWTVELRKRAARIFEHHLDDPEQALRQWRTLLVLRGRDTEVLDALHRLESPPEVDPADYVEVTTAPDLTEPDEDNELPVLEQLYRKHENYAELLDVLRLQARKEADPQRRKTLYYEVAKLATEKLGRPEDAVQAYLDLLAGDMHNLSVIRRLNRLYLAMEPAG